MTDINEIIAEVLRLDEHATLGPWWYEPHWGDIYDTAGEPPYRSRRGVTDSYEDGAAIVGARGQDVVYEGTFTPYDQTAGHIGLTEEDRALIPYYRTAAPALAREVQRLQAELKRSRPSCVVCGGSVHSDSFCGDACYHKHYARLEEDDNAE